MMSSKYTTKLLIENDFDIWNNLVENSDEGTIFHTTHWLNATNHNYEIIGCYKGEKIVGGGAFIQNKNSLRQKSISSPPLTPYSGIIFEKDASKKITRYSDRKKITDKILAYLDDKYQDIRISLPPQFEDIQPFIWNGFEADVSYTYLLKLDDTKLIWKQMDSSLRRDIRRAEKDGLKIQITDDFKTMLELVKKTFQRQDHTFKTKEKYALRYNQALKKINKCKSFICYDDTKPIAGVYIVWDNKRSYYLLGGYDSKNSHHGAGALAMWTAIKYTTNKLHLKEFDFEGSMIQPVEKYFRKFGGDLTPKYKVFKKNLFLKMLTLLKK
jgi:hypothetical protein